MSAELNLDDLDRLAQAATPGPYKVNNGGGMTYIESQNGNINLARVTAHNQIANAEFIAAFNPTVASELIHRLQKAERDAARYRFKQECDYKFDCYKRKELELSSVNHDEFVKKSDAYWDYEMDRAKEKS